MKVFPSAATVYLAYSVLTFSPSLLSLRAQLSFKATNFIEQVSKSCLTHFIRDNERAIELDAEYSAHNHQYFPYVSEVTFTSESGEFSSKPFGTAFNRSHQNDSFSSFYLTSKSPQSCTFTLFSLKIPRSGSESVINTFFQTLLTFFQDFFYLRENPYYVLFLLEEDPNSDLSTSVFFSCLQYIHTSSRYFVAKPDAGAVYLICLHCSDPLIFHGFATLKDANKVWWDVHRNLSGKTAYTRRRGMKDPTSSWNCEDRKGLFFGNQRACMGEWIAEFMGFKIILNEEVRVPRIASNAFAQKMTFSDPKPLLSIEVDSWQTAVLYRETIFSLWERKEWIPHSTYKDPLSFVLILDKGSLSHSALYEPYDEWTWLFITVSLLVVSGVLAILFWLHFRAFTPEKDEDFTEYFKKLLLMTLGSFLEQNPSDKTAKIPVNSFRVLFGVWLLVSLVISNGYTGTVVSFLCSIVPPSDAPINLQELVESPTVYQIYSADEFYLSESRIYTHLAVALLEEYAWYSKLTHESREKYYLELFDKTIRVLKGTKVRLAFHYDKSMPIPAEFNSLNKPLKVDKHFVYFSTWSNVKRFSKLFETNPNVLVWFPPSESSIAIVATYTVSRNFFSPFFKRYSYYLEEAGFPVIWNTKEEDMSLRSYSERLACFEEDPSMVWNDDGCLNTSGLLKKNEWSSASDKSTASNPLPLKTIESTFAILILGSLIALIVVVFEIVRYRITVTYSRRKDAERLPTLRWETFSTIGTSTRRPSIHAVRRSYRRE